LVTEVITTQVSQEDTGYWVNVMLDEVLEHRAKRSTATAVWLDVKVIISAVRFVVAHLAIEVHHMNLGRVTIFLDGAYLCGKLTDSLLVNRP
jgi:hypothetical protein